MERPSIFTDYYELTMAQAYFLEGRAEETACFDYFFRELPFGGGYVVFAGLTDLLSQLENFIFKKDELERFISLLYFSKTPFSVSRSNLFLLNFFLSANQIL